MWKFNRALTLCLFIFLMPVSRAGAQSVSSGTIQGTVADSQGAVVVGSTVHIKNAVTGSEQTTTTDANGAFRFSNLPFNNYHLEVIQQGFENLQQDVNVRSTVPAVVKLTLAVGTVSQSVDVEATSVDLLETETFAHNDVDISALAKLPTMTPGSGLSDAIMLSTPGVVADSNGFFHPLGDHAQTSFSIDGQPISDQQSKAFSTQIPVNAIQSMELVTGTPNAEYGDKTSLVVNATTRSGLGLTKPTGSLLTTYGSFGTISQEATIGIGTPKIGYFLAANGERSGRFLDTPEFAPIHAVGNSSSAFNRGDYNPTNNDALHLNVFLARNWFQIPNTYDQLNQDQRQKVVTVDIAPGYQHTFNQRTLLTINPYIREDRVNFYPSGNAFDDSPATLSQHRTLTNWGLRSDVSFANSINNLKVGGQATQTRLNENFSVGVTNNLYNAVCVDSNGNPQAGPGIANPSNCANQGLVANPNFQPGLIALDLTRGGSLFQFADKGNINEYAVYVQDTITLKHLTLNPGVRMDHYAGLTTDTAFEPRFGVSYQAGKTVLRAGYAHTMETPYNENLLLSSAAGAKGLTDVFGAQGDQPLQTGRRNQYNTGFQQALTKYFMLDGDYFWKYTTNAYDFDVILNTPVTFPISWQKSKLDGFSLRLSTPTIHGFQGYTSLGHTRARYFGPEDGVLLFSSPIDATVCRIDHDQALQSTTNLRYQWKKSGPWVGFTWRYDSGLVAGAVGGLSDLLALTAAQQAAVGFFCGNTYASLGNPITSCTSPTFGATRLRIPAPGTENDDTNPPRIAPRNIFDIGMGTDNLLMKEGPKKVTLKFSISNITNKIALYNFLSTFSGTHFIAPRTYEGAIGFSF